MKPERLSRDTIYESPWVSPDPDKVRLPKDHIIEKYYLIDFPHAAVAVIVENALGNIVFIRITHYTAGLTDWELPSGGIDVGETEIEAARREVLEETGYTTGNHQLIYSYYQMNGSYNKVFHIVHCKAIELVQEFDENEVSETHWFTRDEIKKMIKDKAITDRLSVIALCLWLWLQGESTLP